MWAALRRKGPRLKKFSRPSLKLASRSPLIRGCTSNPFRGGFAVADSARVTVRFLHIPGHEFGDFQNLMSCSIAILFQNYWADKTVNKCQSCNGFCHSFNVAVLELQTLCMVPQIPGNEVFALVTKRIENLCDPGINKSLRETN